MRQLHALLMPSRQRRGGLPAHGTRRSNDVGFLRIRHPHVETVGATRRFLPKYSPDLHPIELCFAKLKTILRVARCRAREERWATIGACVPRFAPTECRNYFRHCGYSGATRS